METSDRSEGEILQAWADYLQARESELSSAGEQSPPLGKDATEALDRIEGLAKGQKTDEELRVFVRAMLVRALPGFERHIVLGKPEPNGPEPSDKMAWSIWQCWRATESMMESREFEREHGGLQRLP